jgi:hypothetical protein
MTIDLSRASAIVLGLAILVPMAVHAQTLLTPTSSAQSISAASQPSPTVLRGSPPTPASPAPTCPPGYSLAPNYGCLPPAAYNYSEGWPSYDYWPDFGFGYIVGGFHHSRRFARFHGFARKIEHLGAHGRR